MTDREALRAQLIAHEGLRLQPYTDTVGKLTIGVGRNLTDRGISKAEALYLLDRDLDDAIRDCLSFSWFVDLDSVRQRAWVDLVFNMGLPTLKTFTATIAAMARQDYAAAAKHLLASKWARQVKGRAVTIAAMVRDGRMDGG